MCGKLKHSSLYTCTDPASSAVTRLPGTVCACCIVDNMVLLTLSKSLADTNPNASVPHPLPLGHFAETPPRKVISPACYLMSSPYRLPVVPRYPPWLIDGCSDQSHATLHCYVSCLLYSSIPAISSLITTLTFGRDPQKEFLFFPFFLLNFSCLN